MYCVMLNPQRILQHIPLFFKPQYISAKQTYKGFFKNICNSVVYSPGTSDFMKPAKQEQTSFCSRNLLFSNRNHPGRQSVSCRLRGKLRLQKGLSNNATEAHRQVAAGLTARALEAPLALPLKRSQCQDSKNTFNCVREEETERTPSSFYQENCR